MFTIARLGIAGLAAGAVVLAAGACGSASGPGVTVRSETVAPYAGPAIGKVAVTAPAPAPPIAGTDLVTGHELSLAAFAGRPVIVNFWASWCTGCRQEAGALQRIADTHPQAVVLGVDTNDSAGDARSFYRRYGLRHPTIADPDAALAARYAVPGLPTTFFLDRRHRIVAKIYGAADSAELEQGLRLSLQGP